MHRTTRVLIALAAIATVATTSVGAQGGVRFSSEQIQSQEYTIWTGERIVFTKADGADPTVAENQDRISENVWITRGNDGGQIFNIAQEESASKTESPVGTLWALGTTSDLPDLTFRPFRAADGKPKTVPGKDFVLFLEQERVFIDVRFRSWSKEKAGGFSYERTTPE